MVNILNNNVLITLLILFIILYGLNLGKNKLPDNIKNLFNNTIFKIIFLSLLLIYTSKNSTQIALIIAILFVLTLEYINNQDMKETLAYLESFMNNNEKAL